MPDARKAHFRYPTQQPSLLNIPVEPFRSAATSLYGSRGPQRAAPDYAARKPLSTPPESLEHYIQDSIARVAGLTGSQRRALQGELMRTVRDVGFIRAVHEQSLGPHSDQAQGRPMLEGQPL